MASPTPFCHFPLNFSEPCCVSQGSAALLGLAMVAAGSWDCSFDFPVSLLGLWKVTRLATSSAFWVHTHRDEAGKPILFPEWSVLEEDIRETEEFSFNFSVLGEMDSSLAPCALQEMQLSRLCLCHCKCSPDISWAGWGMGNRLCPQLLHTEQKTNGTAMLRFQCCWEEWRSWLHLSQLQVTSKGSSHCALVVGMWPVHSQQPHTELPSQCPPSVREVFV